MPVFLLKFSLNYATLLSLVNTSTVAVIVAGLFPFAPSKATGRSSPLRSNFRALFLSQSLPIIPALRPSTCSNLPARVQPPPLGKKKKKRKISCSFVLVFPRRSSPTLFAVTTTTIPEIFYPGPSSPPLSPIGPAAVSTQRNLYSVSYLGEQSNLILKIYRANLLFLFSNSVLDRQLFKEKKIII